MIDLDKERNFLHELANLMAFVQGQTYMLNRKLSRAKQAQQALDQDDLELALGRLKSANQKVVELVHRHRNEMFPDEPLPAEGSDEASSSE